MAKRRRRRKHHGGHRRRRRRGGGGVGLGIGGMAGGLRNDAPLIIAAAAYGKLEALSKSDANFVLNKVPKPIVGLGFAGNTALAMYVLGHFTKNRYVKLFARGTAAVAAYQLAARGKLFAAGTDIPTLSGPSVHTGYGSGRAMPPEAESNRRHIIDDDDIGALEYEDQHDASSHT